MPNQSFALSRQRRRASCARSVSEIGNTRKIIESAVGAVFEIPDPEIGASGRGTAQACFARQVAMYLAHVSYGLTLTEVGELFGRDRTTVAYACTVIEGRRDDANLDLCLDHLESAVAHISKAQVSACRAKP